MQSLPIFVRVTGRPVALVGVGETAEAKRRLLERAGARVVGEEDAVALAIVADGDEAAVARLRGRGVLVNAVDRPDLCDWTLPAIVDRSPVIVAVGTDGASAGLAKAIRQRLETLLPQSLGALAVGLKNARDAMRKRFPDTVGRRRALEEGFAPGGLLDPFADRHDVARWLAEGQSALPSRYVVTLRSDDPDDLSLRDARMLGEADRIVAATDVPPAILARARADAERLAVAPTTLQPGVTVEVERAVTASARA